MDLKAIAENLKNQDTEEIAARLNKEFYTDEAAELARVELIRRGVKMDKIASIKSDYIDTPDQPGRTVLKGLGRGLIIFVFLLIPAIGAALFKDQLNQWWKKRDQEKVLTQAIDQLKTQLPMTTGELEWSDIQKGDGMEMVYVVAFRGDRWSRGSDEMIKSEMLKRVCLIDSPAWKLDITVSFKYKADDNSAKSIKIVPDDCIKFIAIQR